MSNSAWATGAVRVGVLRLERRRHVDRLGADPRRGGDQRAAERDVGEHRVVLELGEQRAERGGEDEERGHRHQAEQRPHDDAAGQPVVEPEQLGRRGIAPGLIERPDGVRAQEEERGGQAAEAGRAACVREAM